MSLSIRPAVPNDIPLILQLIRKLAEYERLLTHAVATAEDLQKALFGERPVAQNGDCGMGRASGGLRFVLL